MSNFAYRGFEITMAEAHGFTVTNEGGDYTVAGYGKIVYKASSSLGNSFAVTPQEALDGAKTIIDSKTGHQLPAHQQQQ